MPFVPDPSTAASMLSNEETAVADLAPNRLEV